MSITTRIIGAVLLVCWATTGQAQQRIGYVDLRSLVDSSPLSEKATAKMRAEFGPRQDEIKEQIVKLRERRKELELMSAEQRLEAEQEIIKLERKIKRDERDLQEEVNIRRNSERKVVLEAIREAVEQLAKDKGYDLILSNGVLYASDGSEVTDQVLELLQKQQSAN